SASDAAAVRRLPRRPSRVGGGRRVPFRPAPPDRSDFRAGCSIATRLPACRRAMGRCVVSGGLRRRAARRGGRAHRTHPRLHPAGCARPASGERTPVSTTQQVARPTDPTGGRPVGPRPGALRPLGLSEIALTGGFWSCRQRTNAQATLAHCQMWMERLGWVANFDRVADATTRPDRPGLVFSDSEIYKLPEAMAWEFGRTVDLRVDAAFRALSERV